MKNFDTKINKIIAAIGPMIGKTFPDTAGSFAKSEWHSIEGEDGRTKGHVVHLDIAIYETSADKCCMEAALGMNDTHTEIDDMFKEHTSTKRQH